MIYLCYVHMIQYNTATIRSNATQSRLHSYRFRPRRSGTMLTGHDSELTASTVYIFGLRRVRGRRIGWWEERANAHNPAVQRMIGRSFLRSRKGFSRWKAGGLRGAYLPACSQRLLSDGSGLLAEEIGDPETPAGLRLARP